MNHENPKKVLRNVKEAIQSAMFIAGDAKNDHENDVDRLAYEYLHGKEEGLQKAFEIVQVFEGDL